MEFITSLINYLISAFQGQSPYILIAIKILIAVTAGALAWIIIRRVLRSIEKKSDSIEFIQINSKTFKLIRKVIFLILVITTGSYLIQTFHIRFFENIFYALVIILLAAPVKELLMAFFYYYEQNIVKKTETKFDDTIIDFLNKFSGFIIYAVAIIMALDILGINIMPFIAGAGIAGIAIGFASKDTLSNLIAGILLILDRPFEIGDRIEVWSAPAGSSTWGDVIEIGLRATKIQTTDNIIIIIPNNEIMKRDIVNYTHLAEKIRVRVNIGIAYEANTQLAKKIILDVASRADWVLKNPKPKVVVRNFGESSVDLQARIWIDNARKRMDTISFVTDNVKEAFDREGIEIPYPKREIYVIQKDVNHSQKPSVRPERETIIDKKSQYGSHY